MAAVRFVFIEGNIGAGKSTYLDRILPRLSLPPGHRVIGVPEPLDAWTAIPGNDGQVHNLFAAFYANGPRYAALFQAHAMQTRITAIEMARRKGIASGGTLWIVCERSVFTDRNIFVRALVEAGTMSPMEHAVYEAWWTFWRNGNPLRCCDDDDASGGSKGQAPVVYLATPARECQTRMQHRDRVEESGVPISYLATLERLHAEALGDGTRGWLNSPCLRVDVVEAGNFAADDAAADACAAQLATWMLSLEQ